MRRTVHLIRHAQSTFNAHFEEHRTDPMHIDARLTPLGQAQAAAARATIGRTGFDLVVTSPFTRAIETTLAIFQDHDGPIHVEALHREWLESSCDVGRSPAALAREFPRLAFDHLDDPWWHAHGVPDARGIPQEPAEAFAARLAGFRGWLAARPEPRIAVIGHGTFFFHLTGARLANCEMLPWPV